MLKNSKKKKSKLTHLVILILISYSLAQTQNLAKLNIPSLNNLISVHEESGAMYTFNGSAGISIYTRSGQSTISTYNTNHRSLVNVYDISSINYGQIIYGNHLAMIVQTTGNSNLRLQVQKYDLGQPPQSFGSGTGSVIEADLQTADTSGMYNIDWYLSQPDKLFVLCNTKRTTYLAQYTVTSGFLTYVQ